MRETLPAWHEQTLTATHILFSLMYLQIAFYMKSLVRIHSIKLYVK